MYNEERKRRYISEKMAVTLLSPDYLELQFGKVADTEAKLGKDVCDFSAYEAIDYYKSLNSTSLEFLRCLNSSFSQYTQWCHQRNLVSDNQNHFLEIKEEQFIQCLNKFLFNKRIVTKETLYEWIDKIPNPVDQFFLIALFEFGKSKDFVDITRAKLSDINGNEMKLHTGRTVKVTDKFIRIAKAANEELLYTSLQETQRSTMMKPSEYIVKPKFNANVDASDFKVGRRVYNSVTKIFKYLDVDAWMTPNALVESGKLNMILEKSKEYGVTPKEFIYTPEYLNEVMQQYDCNIHYMQYARKYSDFL